jgi:hypothetical protein
MTVPLKYSKVSSTFALSTPSTSALVLSLALTVVLRKPSTYTWYISMMPGGQSGGFHPGKNNEKFTENKFSVLSPLVSFLKYVSHDLKIIFIMPGSQSGGFYSEKSAIEYGTGKCLCLPPSGSFFVS